MLDNLRLSHSGKCSLVDVHQLNALVLLLVSGIFSTAVNAEGSLSPYVGVSVVKDDNLYRLDSDVNLNELASKISKDDTIYQTKAGVALDWMLSRQRVLADVSVMDNRFEKNSNLNYIGHALNLKWNWLFGSSLTGQLGWDQTQTLNDFSNTATQDSSKKDQRTVNFEAKWRYAPDWEMGVKLSDYDLSYDLLALQRNDRRSVKKTVFLNYITRTGNSVGVSLLREDGEYPGRKLNASSIIDNKYQQDTVLLNVVWQVTAKSKLSSALGWNSRVHPNLAARDNDGFNAKVSYAWFPTVKTMFDVSLYRQLRSSDRIDSTFSENSGYAFTAVWQKSEKLSFNGMFKSEVREYPGQVNSFTEDYSWIVAGVTYRPYSMLDISLKLNQAVRGSTQSLRDYDSQSVILDFNIKF